MDLARMLKSGFRERPAEEPRQMLTPWGEALDRALPLPEHPRPQFARDAYRVLNGRWDFVLDRGAAAAAAQGAGIAGNGFAHADPSAIEGALSALEPPIDWRDSIVVPFSPESLLSGVTERVEPDDLLWYRLVFDRRDLPTVSDACRASDEGLTMADVATTAGRLIVHFEAVDYICAAWLNNALLGTHVGGYLPFSFDATDALVDGRNELVLCVFDPSDRGVQPRGKQRLDHDGIWYTPTSGIWQPVWAESVPDAHLASVDLFADYDSGVLHVDATIAACPRSGGAAAALSVRVLEKDGCVAGACRVEVPSVSDGAAVRADVPVVAARAWSPEDPFLYDVEIELACSGSCDLVHSYCAFRTVSMEPDGQGIMRLCLNHRPVLLRGVLDQGYWSDGIMTAPSDEAFVHDIQAMRAHGFNLLRKHIKIERDRWYYHCDRLGMLVLQDMVSGGDGYSVWYTSRWPTLLRWTWSSLRDDVPAGRRRMAASDARYRDEWEETCAGAVRHLRSHPCIVAWGLFNEAWGQFDARRECARVHALDPTRPIDATSGWYDQNCGEFVSVHNYFRPLEVYADRKRERLLGARGAKAEKVAGAASPASCGDYPRAIAAASKGVGSGAAGTVSSAPASPFRKRAFLISEFGGLTFHIPEHSSLSSSYGYEDYDDIDAWRAALGEKIAQMEQLEPQGLAGYVYTQLSDVEEETNGILTYDRRIDKLATGD